MGTLAPSRAILFRAWWASPHASPDASCPGSPRRKVVAEGARRGCLGPARAVTNSVGGKLYATGERKAPSQDCRSCYSCCCLLLVCVIFLHLKELIEIDVLDAVLVVSEGG